MYVKYTVWNKNTSNQDTMTLPGTSNTLYETAMNMHTVGNETATDFQLDQQQYFYLK